MTNRERRELKRQQEQLRLEEEGLPRSRRLKGILMVDPQIARWRKARKRAKLNARGETEKVSREVAMDRAEDVKVIKNIFMSDDET